MLAFRRIQRAEDFGKATHIYVKSNSGIDYICKISVVNISRRSVTVFRFEELIY
jgi:hypothetical protein